MPEYAGFSIALASQYDAATIPESRVRVLSAPTHLDRIATESPGLGVQHSDKTFQDRGDGAKGTVVEACVPVWAGSQFWVCYACPPPSAGEDEDSQDEDVEKEVEEDVKYFYFKLYVSGRCVLSWGVGEEGKWKGKTMFGLFDGGRDFEGRRIVEKRGLFFPNDVLGCRTDDDGFEIRIFRAKARRREVVDYQGMSEMVGGPDRAGFLLDLTSIGKVQRGERQRFYSYALIDAKDEPWVTFRYKLEPEEDDTTQGESTFLTATTDDTTTTSVEDLPSAEAPGQDVTESSLWSDLEQNTPPTQPSAVNPEPLPASRRLSFPPRNPLFSTTTRAEPSSPIKQLTSASDDDLTQPRTIRHVQFSSQAVIATKSPRRTTGLRRPELTAVRTASPAREIDAADEAEVVMPAHRKSSSVSGGLLKSVVASALRRREDKKA